MRIYSDQAWKIAELYSHLLVSETRDLAAYIDMAIDKKIEQAAKVAEAQRQPAIAFEIRKLLGPKQESILRNP